MQAIYEVAVSTPRMVYRLADQTIVVEARDTYAARIIERLFAGWYLTPVTVTEDAAVAPAIVIASGVKPPEIPRAWPQFEIAGGGVCYTDGKSSFIEVENSIVAIDHPRQAVEVWINGMVDLQSTSLTRVVTYALAAALRRRGLFELHSGAAIDPLSGQGLLIIGPSGSGKSTLTVQLATAGWSFLTDDVLVLSSDRAGVRAWPLRRCFAITAETFAASDFLRARASIDYTQAQPENKKQFAPHHIFNSEFKEQCVPKHLFFSQLSGGERSRVVRLSSPEVMTRLIRMNPWSGYDRWTAPKHLAVLSALVTQCAGYSLLAGRDLLDPKTAVELIADYTRD
ncbi:MAG TPA: hypothetical protein VGW76_19080 [Pyrinomonadaceae bacterium]|nr:hypothetical protein [Pyrinomonadaceae bacterium]